MMIHSETINITTQGFCDIQDITENVKKILSVSKIKNGTVIIFMPYSTAAITTIENESNLLRDFDELMEKLISSKVKYKHEKAWGEDNGFSHLRASLIGPSLCIPMREGRLLLGKWQNVVAVDFDSKPRKREIIVQIIGE